MPAISENEALISATATIDPTVLAPASGTPVSKNQVATMSLNSSNPNPMPPLGNRKYTLSIFISFYSNNASLPLFQRTKQCIRGPKPIF
jgi:hypothetical protein